jgi:hypothetical protein
MTKRKWTDEQRQAASERMKERHTAEQVTVKRSSMRVPVGGSRNITSVNNTPEGYVDRWVNDKDGRLIRFKNAGYEHVDSASVGDSGVDGTHAEAGVVSRDMGQGVTAYLLRQKQEFFNEDQAAKQISVDATEDSIRRDVKNKLKDGHYGSVIIDRR